MCDGEKALPGEVDFVVGDRFAASGLALKLLWDPVAWP